MENYEIAYIENNNIETSNANDDSYNILTAPETTTLEVEDIYCEISSQVEIPMIELNSATSDDFMKLPNIDEEMALKIVDFRNKIQYFSHPYELLYIDGMSEKLLASVIDYMYIDTGDTSVSLIY